MGSKRFTIALLCVILYSLRSAASDAGSTPSSSKGMVEVPSLLSFPDDLEMSATSVRPVSRTVYATPVDQATPNSLPDPFMLIGEDNILGPPTRRKVIRRTRRRRIKKLKSTTESSTSVNGNGDLSTGTSGSSSFTSTSTENVRISEVRTRIPSTSTENARNREAGRRLTSTSTENVRNSEAGRRIPSTSTENVRNSEVGSRIPSTTTENVRKSGVGRGITSTTMKLQVIPIDSDQSVTDEMSASLPSPSPRPPPTSRLPDPIFKPGHYTRHQRNRKKPFSKANLWRTPNFSVELFDTAEATAEEDNNVGKRESSSSRNKTKNNSYNMFIRPTSLSNLTEMKTDESTNPFVNTSSPISTELQNSLQFTLQVLHPLLNSDSVLTQGEPKIPEDKTVAVTHTLSNTVAETPVAHDVRFLPTHLRKSHPLLTEDSFLESDSASKTGPRLKIHGMHSINNAPRDISTTTETSYRNWGRFTIGTTTNAPTSTTTTSTSERATSPSTFKTSTPPTSRRTTAKSGNVHLEPLGNLKITELVYPTVVQRGADLVSSSTDKPKSTSESGANIIATTSGRPSPVYDTTDNRSPPLILMGSDSSVSELGVRSKGNMDGPPAFDDLLLEELVRGFEPPSTTPRTTTTPTTTTRTTTTTTTTTTTPRPTTITTTRRITTTTEPPKAQDDETSQLLQLLSLLQQPQQTTEAITSTSPLSVAGAGKLDDELLKQLALLDTFLSPTAKTMIKEAVDAGTTEKIKAAKNPSPGSGESLSDADLKAIYMLLDAMSSTTARPTTTTTTPKPAVHPALQGMLAMLNNPWNDIQKFRAQQQAGKPSQPQPTFSVPQPPKPVPTTSSLDLLSQLFNLNLPKSQTDAPKASQNSADLGLGALFGSLIPKRQPANREAAAGSNQLLSFFQPDPPAPTPPAGPYYWFDVNAFLGNDPTAGPTSGFRPKLGTRDYFLKVRKRRDSMERYY